MGGFVCGASWEGWFSLWSIMGRVVSFVKHHGKGGLVCRASWEGWFSLWSIMGRGANSYFIVIYVAMLY